MNKIYALIILFFIIEVSGYDRITGLPFATRSEVIGRFHRVWSSRLGLGHLPRCGKRGLRDGGLRLPLDGSGVVAASGAPLGEPAVRSGPRQSWAGRGHRGAVLR